MKAGRLTRNPFRFPRLIRNGAGVMYQKHMLEVTLFDNADVFTGIGSDENLTPLPEVEVSGVAGGSDS